MIISQKIRMIQNQIKFGWKAILWGKKRPFVFLFLLIVGVISPITPVNGTIGKPKWGFWAHQRINRLAIFTLPPEMLIFFKKHADYITENAVNPDKRRYAVAGEAARHYIDLEAYGDSAAYKLPLYWQEAVQKYGEDTLALNGVVPWAIQQYKSRLTEAFRQRDPRRILRLSADLGHYIADANVPLHTTHNYNGQLTGQEGIHAFWESRLPELFADNYDGFVGAATYESKVAKRAWQAVQQANAALDSVLRFERELSSRLPANQKYALEDRNGIVIKTYSREFSARYHQMLSQQVERQFRASAKMIGDFWFTCWVDAGQPDLTPLGNFSLTETDQQEAITEKQSWLKKLFTARSEGEN
ncbi:MAG: integrase [Cytophagia bacterium]|nr:MAG: integrase [Runella sp.]TAG25330.1 MAG: integrase [Cytophagales bacterium]TAG42491.1 MAG: integrase [Cytophagia bacterium]TAG49615.1 MAG: integrase [Runella slithyformis]TAG73573.1 MAG: integrase [Runella slithyformis]